MNRIKNGNQQLEVENNSSEDIFKYFAHDNQNWILEAVNNDNLPKHLFYQKKINPNPMPILPPTFVQSFDSVLCLENTLEEILSPEDKKELMEYKYKPFKTKRL